MYIPTQEQYLAALEVIKAYEFNQETIFEEKVEIVKNKLTEYFKTTFIKQFSIRTKDWMGNHGVIITPTEPCFDEDYGGEFDVDLEAMSKDFGIHISMDSGIYSK